MIRERVTTKLNSAWSNYTNKKIDSCNKPTRRKLFYVTNAPTLGEIDGGMDSRGGADGTGDVCGPKRVYLIIYYLGPARLSCSGNVNSVQTKTIPTTIPMMTILDLIFFHICYTICFQVLLLFLGAFMRNQLEIFS